MTGSTRTQGSTWEITEPVKLAFDEPLTPLTALTVRLVQGTVNVVGSDDPTARLEVSAVAGPPLTVTRRGSALSVGYGDVPWKRWLKLLGPGTRDHTATVTLTVPAHIRVDIGVVGAEAVVTGVDGGICVQSVSGDTTLVGVAGEVRAESVSGDLEVQALSGRLRYHSVSGDLTVIEGVPDARVRAESVSGDLLLDLAAPADGAARATDVKLTTVSGEVAIRLPGALDAKVDVNTAGGSVVNAFDALRVTHDWGENRISGRLGAGGGTLKAWTMSGSVALLSRPEDEESGPGPGPGPGPDDSAGPADPARPADSTGADSTGKVL
ncbi:DUF4097 family beta strand repeat-containing protein [Streptomyces yaizuensis]|uniref:DUF4097 family beta strand repeat-containing protein n=1 Tax=Streptomyces yaizuensis TaxID=2989713 RepID=A0ABQ5NW58_9ACTN|nr:hypothetical protein [Streptomyces sp. YSPA8]GLF94604.1 DUF4097 family beta strand repeat-containing protein [Streptomyces sp. YSPA8]